MSDDGVEKTKGACPTMTGFVWSVRDVPLPRDNLRGDYWCVRDAFCKLLGWSLGSDEWNAFIEAPSPKDMDPLIEHLGLVAFDPDRGHEPRYADLLASLDHPGVAFYNLHRCRISHCIFQPHVRHLRPLPPIYQLIDPYPEFFRIVVDLRQPPRLS
ncbi:MAG: hypothetical protein M1522_01430 [Actinobacteria bacterium]|nr:hypothetical protein [Actinomycetota bacterium]